MTEFLLGVVVTILFPRAVAALRWAWEAAGPASQPPAAAGRTPEEVIEDVRNLPPDPAILGALADALRAIREKVESPKK